jgi:hypothetical protein
LSSGGVAMGVSPGAVRSVCGSGSVLSLLVVVARGSLGGRQAPSTVLRIVASTARRSSIGTWPGAELLLPTAQVSAEP